MSAATGLDPQTLDAAQVAGRRRRGRLLRDVARRPAGLFGLVVAALVLMMLLLAPVVAPYDPDAQDLANRFAGPSLDHPLGTDNLGRDLLSRIIFGGRVAFLIALPAVAIAVAAGLLLGLAAGWFGRFVDGAMVVVTDALLAFPAVVLALAVIALYGASIRNTVILVGLAFIPGYFRVSRALVLAARNDVYVDAERALGARATRILGAHVLPNVLPPLFILVAMDIPGAIAVESGLSFLGLGVQPPTSDWGVMLNEGFQDVYDSPWPLIAPCAALVVVTLGFTFLGETLRDLVDPRVAQAEASARRRRWGRR